MTNKDWDADWRPADRPTSETDRVTTPRPSRASSPAELAAALVDVRRAFVLADIDGALVLDPDDPRAARVVARVPACPPENLGSRAFRRDHGLEYAYVAGAMAGGIGSVEIVEAMARAGMLGFFGAAGLSLRDVEGAVTRLQASVADRPHGFNLIHTPGEPEVEAAIVDLYIRKGVRLVEASAYLGLTLPLVRYRLHGIHRSAGGKVVTPHRVIAKVSRVEVASRFLAPAPEAMLEKLIAAGHLTRDQAELARAVPVAQDITAEADSGGHTDNRPAITLLPSFIALRDRQQAAYGFDDAPRVGLAGGISTPESAAAAFVMGAAYVLTGSINQACVEAGTSDTVRRMLAEAEQADTIMAPAPDMFEMGVKVQVLKRGTLFAMRGARLYELYTSCDSLEDIPPRERGVLEKTFFRASIEEIWEQTRAYFLDRDPSQVERAEVDPKHRMALVFRWYLGLASRWANRGVADRKADFQIWCGPAMGAFNEWVKGSFLEAPEHRRVVTIAHNLLHGAAVRMRLNTLRLEGIELPAELTRIHPIEPERLEARMHCARAIA